MRDHSEIAEDSHEPSMATLEKKIIAQLKSCYDPEIPVNIYDLGLIYDIQIRDANSMVDASKIVADTKEVNIKMTLTSPNCPAVESLPEEVRVRVGSVDGVDQVNLDLVWEPPFSEEMMSDEAKLALGLL